MWQVKTANNYFRLKKIKRTTRNTAQIFKIQLTFSEYSEKSQLKFGFFNLVTTLIAEDEIEIG
jgi:hypothetical protein